jgi:GNAT superfamily N-acetyltransferase
MYTVQQLAPSELAQFSRLAFPQHRPMLLSGDVEPGFVAIGAKLFGQPVGLAFAGSKDSPGVARLEFCMVDPRQRRAGVGTALLEALESVARNLYGGLEARYLDDPALDRLFAKSGWSAPEALLLSCTSDVDTLSSAPWMQICQFPPEYEVLPWVDVTEAEKAAMLDSQRKNPWFPELLSPFDDKRPKEPITSLALRYRGEIVGWSTVEVIGGDTLRGAKQFVRKDLQATGRSIMLVMHSLQRVPLTGLKKLIFDVPLEYPRMIRFVSRRFKPYLLSIRTLYGRTKELSQNARAAA